MIPFEALFDDLVDEVAMDDEARPVKSRAPLARCRADQAPSWAQGGAPPPSQRPSIHRRAAAVVLSA